MTTRQDIDDYINSYPEEGRQRLRQYQWKIDQELAKCKDPTQRYNKMVEMFYEQVGQFQTALTNPGSLLKTDSPKAEVVELKGRSG